MRSDPPKKQTSPQSKRVDGPPKPPTRVALDLDELGGPSPEDNPLEELKTVLHNATETFGKLVLLNGGGAPLRQESLELSLDRNIVLLGRLIPKLDGVILKLVISRLGSFRDYRRQFPRTDASNREQADQAQRILDGIPEV